MTKKRLSGFLTPTQKRYLEFLEYEDREEIKDNRKTWNEKEKTPDRTWDHQIRWEVKYALNDLRLVFEKFGYIELQALLSDSEVSSNIKSFNERVEFVEAQRKRIRRQRETG